MPKKGEVVAETYLKIPHGGMAVRVVESGMGPELIIETQAYGNFNQKMAVKLSGQALHELKDVLARAYEEEYSKSYVNAAKTLDEYLHSAKPQEVSLGVGKLVGSSQEPIYDEDGDLICTRYTYDVVREAVFEPCQGDDGEPDLKFVGWKED